MGHVAPSTIISSKNGHMLVCIVYDFRQIWNNKISWAFSNNLGVICHLALLLFCPPLPSLGEVLSHFSMSQFISLVFCYSPFNLHPQSLNNFLVYVVTPWCFTLTSEDVQMLIWRSCTWENMGHLSFRVLVTSFNIILSSSTPFTSKFMISFSLRAEWDIFVYTCHTFIICSWQINVNEWYLVVFTP